MFDDIFAGVVSGLITAGILELLRQVRTGRSAGPARTSDSPDVPSVRPKPTRPGSHVGRIVLSTIIGFFFSAFTAGMLEDSGHETIDFGSPLANLLIVIWTVIAWLCLSRARS